MLELQLPWLASQAWHIAWVAINILGALTTIFFVLGLFWASLSWTLLWMRRLKQTYDVVLEPSVAIAIQVLKEHNDLTVAKFEHASQRMRDRAELVRQRIDRPWWRNVESGNPPRNGRADALAGT